MKVCPTCQAQYSGGEVFCPVDAARLMTLSEMPLRVQSDDPLVGQTLGGRYKILRRVGEGGMGIVYEAEHIVIEKKVALKVLRDDFSSRPEVVERFRQEAKSASRIGHQHIVDISDFGATPTGQNYFVMELLDGEDLANVLARDRTVPPQRAAAIALQCCRALDAAHAKGIVHRDMKPENIFLTVRDNVRDFVKIVDFGIAKMSDIETPGAPGRKLTKTGMIFGTPEYMSSEQAAGKALDSRVDIYAIGVILYEMLVGRVPFVGDSFMSILTQHMFDAPPKLRELNPDVVCPRELETVIYKALEKDPNNRYQSMHDLGRAIAAAMDMSGRVWDEDTLSGYGDAVQSSARPPRVVEAAPTLAGMSVPPLGSKAPPPSASISSQPPADGQPHDTVRPDGSRRVRVLAVFGAAALVVGGAVALALSLRMEDAVAHEVSSDPTSDDGAGAGTPASSPPAGANIAGVALPGPRAEPLGATSVPSVAPSATDVRQVTLMVSTFPSGARVSVEGRGVICQSTPCTFGTPAGAPIRIRAERGRAVVERDLAPTETMSIELALVAPARRRPEGPASRTGREPIGRGGVSTSDLKGFPIPPRVPRDSSGQ